MRRLPLVVLLACAPEKAPQAATLLPVCTFTSECASGEACAAGYCQGIGCAEDSDCPRSGRCDGTTSLCVARTIVAEPDPSDTPSITAPAMVQLAPGESAVLAVTVTPAGSTVTIDTVPDGVQAFLFAGTLSVFVAADAPSGDHALVLKLFPLGTASATILISVARRITVLAKDQTGAAVTGLRVRLGTHWATTDGTGKAVLFTHAMTYDLVLPIANSLLNGAPASRPLLVKIDALSDDTVQLLFAVVRAGYPFDIVAAPEPVDGGITFGVHSYSELGTSTSTSGNGPGTFDISFAFPLVAPPRMAGEILIYEENGAARRLGRKTVDVSTPARNDTVDLGTVPMTAVTPPSFTLTVAEYAADTFNFSAQARPDGNIVGFDAGTLTPSADIGVRIVSGKIPLEIAPMVLVETNNAADLFPTLRAEVQIVAGTTAYTLPARTRPTLQTPPALAAETVFDWSGGDAGLSRLSVWFDQSKNGLIFLCYTTGTRCSIPDVAADAPEWALPKSTNAAASVARFPGVQSLSALQPVLNTTTGTSGTRLSFEELYSAAVTMVSAP